MTRKIADGYIPTHKPPSILPSQPVSHHRHTQFDVTCDGIRPLKFCINKKVVKMISSYFGRKKTRGKEKKIEKGLKLKQMKSAFVSSSIKWAHFLE